MRASREHMEKTRRHILEAAAEGFREQGYGGLGINGLAQRAGMTSGAFYGHFASKDEAFKAVVTQGLKDYATTVNELVEQHGEQWPTAFLDFYLGDTHVENLACSCAIPALSADVVRSDADTRKEYGRACKHISNAITDGLTRENDRDALALMALLSGAVVMARSVSNKKQASAILEAARHWANRMVSES